MADHVGQQLGNYRLLRVLGQGAFATVYLGEHQYLERLAAIKVLHVRMESQTHESFLREARTIAQLRHPHIIGVHDFGIEDQTPYLVMEYMPSGALCSCYPKGTRLPFDQIMVYVKQLASALDYAHEQHVIHRDVKAENLLLGTNHEVVLSDFGIAVVQSTLESLSMQNPAGTPIYMAPEQIQHQPCMASDQYALGVMVYEWLCGEPPFYGTLFEVFSQHLHKPPPSLHARLPHLPSAVEDAVFVALAKDPGQRFASVTDFATALSDASFATQPISLCGSLEHKPHDQTTFPLASATSVPASSPNKEDHSDYVTQPHLTAAQHMERELVSSGSPQPTTQSQTVPKQARQLLTQTDRKRLLRRVRSFWITGVLEQSLHGAALIALGLQEQPDAVANPWHLVVHHPDAEPCPLRTGTRIKEVYDAADGELLILGAPGSGKTTLLLELARDLLERAEYDEQHPIPMVFNLSSWVMKRQPLIDWLVEELVSKYQVPRKLGQALVNTDQILPLLDGLDEVAPKERTTCIETINLFRQEHGLLSLVVCSRSADYLAQNTRILLRSAVVIQPLSIPQIDSYLCDAGPQVEALRMALHHDPDLQELAMTPLMLNIFILAYQDTSLHEIAPLGTLPAKQQQVFATYVQRMLSHHGTNTHYTSQQTVHWLSWLAKQMKQRSQTELYIERLQPSWLPNQHRRQYYRGLVSGLTFGIASALLSAILCLVFIGPRTAIASGAVVGLIAGLLFFTLGYTTVDLKEREHLLHNVQIHPAEMIILSPAKLWESIGNGLFYGCISTVFFTIFTGAFIFADPLALLYHRSSGITFTFVQASGFYVGAILLLIILNSLSGEQLDKSALFQPNQGIRYSVRNSMFVGILSGGAIGTVVGVITGIGWVGMIAGVVVGVIIGLHMGGFASIQHFLLRWLLWQAGSIPWNYPHFLDHAAEHILLRKVGGGYIFVHRLLLEYFASLDTASTLDTARQQAQFVS